eukprot:11708635-Ditylum_brightwellii.AAC.1
MRSWKTYEDSNLDNFNVAKFRSAPGDIKSVVNCMLLEEQLGLLDLESTVQPQRNQLFPVAVALGDHGHGTPRTSFHMGIPIL